MSTNFSKGALDGAINLIEVSRLKPDYRMTPDAPERTVHRPQRRRRAFRAAHDTAEGACTTTVFWCWAERATRPGPGIGGVRFIPVAAPDCP
jgi:hypothetical protein